VGTVILMGGNEFRENCIPMDRQLLTRISHRPPRVLILPTAAAKEKPFLAAKNGIRYFEALGALAAAPMIISRQESDDPVQAPQFKKSDLIYLTGGDPRHLLECLQDSSVWEAVKDRFLQGGMIAGSSAGAMVLGEKMFVSTAGWIQGLGLVPRVAVIPHYEGPVNERMKLLRQSLEPYIVILGIAAATACINNGAASWQVAGEGCVSVFSLDKAFQYGPGQSFQLPEDEPAGHPGQEGSKMNRFS